MRKIYKIEDGEVVEVYKSVTEASYESGLSKTVIHQAIREKRETTKGLYVDDTKDIKEYRKIGWENKKRKRGCKVKVVYKEGYRTITEHYDCLSEAADKYNIKYNTIHRELKEYSFWTYNGLWFYKQD